MRVTVKAYSVFRDYIGDEVVLELEPGTTVRELLALLAKKFNIPSNVKPVVIVGKRVVKEDYVINEEVVVYITPPFSGGVLGSDFNYRINTKLIREDEYVDFNKLITELTSLDPEAGALAMFIGFVKGVVQGNRVYELEYTALEDVAKEVMEKIARETLEKYGLRYALIWHRIGRVKHGNITLVVAAVSTTRKTAEKAVEEMVERVKNEVPIFKLEKRSDGEYWVIGDGKRVPRLEKQK